MTTLKPLIAWRMLRALSVAVACWRNKIISNVYHQRNIETYGSGGSIGAARMSLARGVATSMMNNNVA